MPTSIDKVALRRWMIGQLRRIITMVPRTVDGGARTAAKARARTGYGRYKCALCGTDGLPATALQLDHVQPIINPDTGWVSYDNWIERAVVDAQGYSFICIPCHKAKSVSENRQRYVTKNS